MAILCDGQELLVAPHLHQGLRCMTIFAGAEVLWVDAICINQQNLHEKAQQVRDMHTVFKTAAEVFVWLGEGDDSSALAMHAISRMQEVIKILPFSLPVTMKPLHNLVFLHLMTAFGLQ